MHGENIKSYYYHIPQACNLVTSYSIITDKNPFMIQKLKWLFKNCISMLLFKNLYLSKKNYLLVCLSVVCVAQQREGMEPWNLVHKFSKRGPYVLRSYFSKFDLALDSFNVLTIFDHSFGIISASSHQLPFLNYSIELDFTSKIKLFCISNLCQCLAIFLN